MEEGSLALLNCQKARRGVLLLAIKEIDSNIMVKVARRDSQPTKAGGVEGKEAATKEFFARYTDEDDDDATSYEEARDDGTEIGPVVNVGDHIVTIDDRQVTTLEDFKVNSDKKRNFTVVRAAESSESSSHQESNEDPDTVQEVPSGTASKGCAPTTYHTTITKKKNVADEFVVNKFTCTDTGTVNSDSESTIKTIFKPIASLLQCGQADQVDHSLASNNESEIMMTEIPSITDVSQLKVSDHAFIKRSNGEWTHSTVLEVGRGSITFSLDKFGNIKTITKQRWASSIRLVKSGTEDAVSRVAEEDDEDSTSTSSSEGDSLESASSLDSEEVEYASGQSSAQRKAQLKALVETKKIVLKAKKEAKKRQIQQAKAAAGEFMRELKETKKENKMAQKARKVAAAKEAKARKEAAAIEIIEAQRQAELVAELLFKDFGLAEETEDAEEIAIVSEKVKSVVDDLFWCEM